MKIGYLIGISVIAVLILILSSLSNVLGYQTVQSSKQNMINNKINQKELLFRTIIDIAKNKDIQRIIIKFQVSHGEFPVLDNSVLTTNHLKQIYLIGLMFSKYISKSKIHSIVQQHQMSSFNVQQEISAIIEKDAVLNEEITQLSNYDCDCENKNVTRLWHFPVLCLLLFPIYVTFFGLYIRYGMFEYLFLSIMFIGLLLDCFWII